MRILLVVYDNGSYMNSFPMSLAYIAAVLRKQGCNVFIYNQDMHHYPDEHLMHYLNKNYFDVVGVSVIAGYYQYRKLLSISHAINNSENRPFYIIGGHGPSPEPEFFLRKTMADAAVIGEGEETIIELIQALQYKKTLSGIRGVAFRNSDGSIVINERRPLIRDIDTIPFPAYELFPIYFYRLIRMTHSKPTDFVMPIITGRGCTFQCTFCYRMDEGFRPRRNEAIIEEINLLKKDYGITSFSFFDELTMSSIDRTLSLCEDFIRADLNIQWQCNGRLNYAKPEVIQLMKKAGCVFINYGIEAFDNTVLKNINKGLTTDLITKGVETTLNGGISAGLNILFGNIGDNKKTLKKGVEFLLKYDDGAQLRTIRPVTPYPGSQLYYDAIKMGLLNDCEDFYSNKHVNSDLLSINFTDLSNDEFHQALLESNTILINNYFERRLKTTINEAKRLYSESHDDFRGFRQI